MIKPQPTLSSSFQLLARLPQSHIHFIEAIVTRYGPELSERIALDQWLKQTSDYVRDGQIDAATVTQFWREITLDYFANSMQGHVRPLHFHPITGWITNEKPTEQNEHT